MAHADQVIPDDLIVQSSICVGFDSVDGESFGSDTLRLKENNLRIHFDDTSTSAGFPANDWRLTANDSDAGGANYFAIDDATAGTRPFWIRAGAPNNALYVGDNGGIGINTTSTDSQMKIQILGADTPGVRLQQDSSGGYTPQTWDMGGNEANFFIRDLTGGSKLSFRIRPGAPTSSVDIGANGNVGIGTADPKAKLHVHVDAGQGVLIGNSTASGNTNLTKASATLHVDGNALIATRLGIGSTNVVSNAQALYVEGTAFISQTLEIGSSRARKENIRDVSLEEARATLKELQPVHFNYKGDGEQQLGFIAEDVPDVVATQSRKSLVPMDFVAVLTKVVQDHDRRETELRATVNAQQKLLKELAAKLATVEERLQQAGANSVAGNP